MADDLSVPEGQESKPQEARGQSKVTAAESKEPLIPDIITPTLEGMELRDELSSQEKLDDVREELEQENNLYNSSTIIGKLQKRQELGLPLRIAFLDIDSTLTGNPESQKEVRQLLEKQGYGVCFVTSRTEEMVMSKTEFYKSKELGFNRPEPHLGEKEGRRNLAFPEELKEFEGLYDPDIIAGTTGSRILVRQENGGYALDSDFENQQKQTSEEWRNGAMEVLQYIDPEGKLYKLSPLENAQNYSRGEIDVYSPDFRIQVEFSGLESKRMFKEKFKQALHNKEIPENLHRQLQNIRLTEDSSPEKGRLQIYLTPFKGYKARAEENIVSNISESLGVNKSDLELLIAGDSYPDLAMGLYGGVGTRATFLLVGGSRLTEAITQESIRDFAGEEMSAVKNRLVEKGKGEFEFKVPLFGARKVIVGDKVYPGTKSVETVKAYLNKQE